VLLLYGAGLRASEALGLSVDDVDLSKALLTVRDTKFFESRLVPIGQDHRGVLASYAQWRVSTHPSAGAGSHFVVGNHGAGIHLNTLEKVTGELHQELNCPAAAWAVLSGPRLLT
jgi:site-specific recombinase XerD